MNQFRVAQKVLLLNQYKEVLVIRFADNERSPVPFRAKWDLPGGGLEWGESLEEGLARELREEIGEVQVEVGNLIHRWDWVHVNNSELRTICLLYKGDYLGGEVTLNEEHDEYRWVKLDQLLELDWHSNDKPAIELVVKKLSLT